MDFAAIRNSISLHEVAIASLDDEINALTAKVRQLEYHRYQHSKKIRNLKGMITLARRMPAEILAMIFEMCVRDGWTRTPLFASHVCREWRMAASSPTVWSHVYVNLDARFPYERTRFWLEKAQEALLHVSIDVERDVSWLEGVMHLLVSRISRWSRFSVKVVLLEHANLILQLCNRPSPELRLVEISVLQEQAGIDLFSLRNSFPKAPILRSARIYRTVLPSHGIVPTSVTDLSLLLPSFELETRTPVSSVLQLLEDIPHIKVFAIAVPTNHNREFEADADSSRFVELPQLNSLTLSGPSSLFGILPHIRTPSLANLHLHSSVETPGYPDEQTGLQIRQLFERSAISLTLLELRDVDLPLSDFTRIFSLSSSLEELRLHESDIKDSVLAQLNGPGGMCPRLCRLDFRWCGQLTGQALVDLVQSRREPTSAMNPITEITVINCSYVKEQDIMALARTTVCRLIMRDHDDLCRAVGCCRNERYRKRLGMRRIFHRPSADAVRVVF